MARIRTIKPEFYSSPGTKGLDPYARLLFIAMWNWADDTGKGTANPGELRGFAFPNDDDLDSADIRRMLGGIRRAFGVVFYEVGGRPYYFIPSWEKHQKIDKRSGSRHPNPEDGTPYDPDPNQSSDQQEPENSEETRRIPPSPRRDPGAGTGEQGNRGTGEKDRETTSPLSEIAPRPSDTASDRPEIERICEHLADRIEANGSKRPTVTKKWRETTRLMLDRDGRTTEQIHACIDWCQDDDFWRSNVMSMPKVREKYDQLRMAAQRKPPGRPTGRRRSTRDEAFLQHQALKAELFGTPDNGSPLNLIRGELA